MKKIILLIAPILISLTILSQSDDELSDGYFMRANQAYGNGNLKEALIRLDKSASYLNETHPGIEALYVKVYKEQGDYISAERHLEKYFNKAQKEHKEYQEMLSLAVDVRDGADLQREKKRKEIEAKKQKLKEEQERLLKEQQERERKAREKQEKKQEFEEKISALNNYVKNKSFSQAKGLYNEIKDSEFYADYKVNNIEDLKCYINYDKAKRVNTVYAYDKYIRRNSSCYNIKDAKEKLKTKSIEDADKLSFLKSKEQKTKAIEYYKIYLSNFPNGDKSSYAKNQITKMNAQIKRTENEAKMKSFIHTNKYYMTGGWSRISDYNKQIPSYTNTKNYFTGKSIGLERGWSLNFGFNRFLGTLPGLHKIMYGIDFRTLDLGYSRGKGYMLNSNNNLSYRTYIASARTGIGPAVGIHITRSINITTSFNVLLGVSQSNLKHDLPYFDNSAYARKTTKKSATQFLINTGFNLDLNIGGFTLGIQTSGGNIQYYYNKENVKDKVTRMDIKLGFRW